MLGFSKKRFLITLTLSVVVWVGGVFLQAIWSFKATFSLLGPSCSLTGFPIAACLYDRPGQVPAWGIALTNLLVWFWVIHLLWNGFSKYGPNQKSPEKH